MMSTNSFVRLNLGPFKYISDKSSWPQGEFLMPRHTIARRPYLLGLAEAGNDYPTPPYRGKGWHVDIIEHSYAEVLDKKRKDRESGERLLYGESYAISLRHSERIGNNIVRHYTNPIVLVWAPTRIDAQAAANFIAAALCVNEGYLILDDILALPKPPNPIEDLDEVTYLSSRNTLSTISGCAKAAAIAAKSSTRRRWTYSLLKLWSSFRSCNVHWMEFHPSHGTVAGTTNSPAEHVLLSQAVVAAYSAIEELQLSIGSGVRAYDNDGKMLLEVRGDLDARLTKNGIDPSHPIVWTIRNTPTRIERKVHIPSGEKLAWTRGNIRDRGISLADAIGMARWLRSKASAHTSNQFTRSLTVNDVHNVQMLARRLLLELLGFLPGKSPSAAVRTGK